jgi:hypothetical protein
MRDELRTVHNRVDKVRDKVEQLAREQTALAVKVALICALGSAVLSALLTWGFSLLKG